MPSGRHQVRKIAIDARIEIPLKTPTFRYRILIVDDEPSLRELGKQMLESQGYEVLCAEDGFEGLATLKKSLPDIIISDLRMPNMNGFEFLSVVRRRFPAIPVIAMSAEFAGTIPPSVLADAFFPKIGLRPRELFETICDLLHELPTRPKLGKSTKAAVWVKKDKGTMAVTCSECLRTFPVTGATKGDNTAECDFCSSTVDFEIIGDDILTRLSPGSSVEVQPVRRRGDDNEEVEACLDVAEQNGIGVAAGDALVIEKDVVAVVGAILSDVERPAQIARR